MICLLFSRDLLMLKILISVESNMLEKRKMRTEDASFLDGRQSPVTIRNKSFQRKKGYVGVDWQSTKENYEDLCKTLVSNLPKQTGSEEYAHSGDLFIRERIATKFKQVRVKN